MSIHLLPVNARRVATNRHTRARATTAPDADTIAPLPRRAHRCTDHRLPRRPPPTRARGVRCARTRALSSARPPSRSSSSPSPSPPPSPATSRPGASRTRLLRRWNRTARAGRRGRHRRSPPRWLDEARGRASRRRRNRVARSPSTRRRRHRRRRRRFMCRHHRRRRLDRRRRRRGADFHRRDWRRRRSIE